MYRATSILLLLTLLAVIQGCSPTTYKQADIITPVVQHLDKGQGAYIALSSDGRYGEQAHAGTGMLVAQWLSAAIKPYTSSVALAPHPTQDINATLQAAREANARYVYIPTITHWEQRNTSWSGIPSKGSLTVIVYDVVEGKQVLARSSSVDGLNFHTQDVSELMQEATNQLGAGLFE